MEAASLRDSTQIRLPATAIEGLREELDTRFTLTIRSEADSVRIIGSPSEIKAASRFLSRSGVTVA
ncbi:VNG_1110C family protein [Halococcoides cellulosivorans]|uniref:Uncharacterized protein n=1 Tax=Halococcoides cellulosivorans TaxID=1679096 RepID=A0A2R4X1Y7_9EURY|nr:hypothetical protein [Halococcoides cellulosivorans]AWB27806.1 hypothetical protein HARCEL1_08825 [Halococcoides cellulosivorans]